MYENLWGTLHVFMCTDMSSCYWLLTVRATCINISNQNDRIRNVLFYALYCLVTLETKNRRYVIQIK